MPSRIPRSLPCDLLCSNPLSECWVFSHRPWTVFSLLLVSVQTSVSLTVLLIFRVLSLFIHSGLLSSCEKSSIYTAMYISVFTRVVTLIRLFTCTYRCSQYPSSSWIKVSISNRFHRTTPHPSPSIRWYITMLQRSNNAMRIRFRVFIKAKHCLYPKNNLAWASPNDVIQKRCYGHLHSSITYSNRFVALNESEMLNCKP